MKKTILLSMFIATGTAFAGDYGPPPATEVIDEGFSYDYIDAQYIFTDFGNGWSDGHGWAVNGSKSIGDTFYVTAGYGQSYTDIAGTDIDLAALTLGVGAHFALADGIDLTIEGGGVYADIEGPVDVDDWGYYVGPGLRIDVTQGVEIFTNVHWVDVLESEQIVWTTGGIIELNDSLAIKTGVSYAFDDEDFSVFAGLRFYY